jgi:hypothetical protein
MISIAQTLVELDISDFILTDEPTNETEFNSMFKKVTGSDENGLAILSDDTSLFGVTWAQVSAKKTELENAEPLKLLREVRNTKLAETDWEIVMHKEKGTNIPTALKTYRQALRDITDTYTSLDDVVWPEKP